MRRRSSSNWRCSRRFHGYDNSQVSRLGSHASSNVTEAGWISPAQPAWTTRPPPGLHRSRRSTDHVHRGARRSVIPRRRFLSRQDGPHPGRFAARRFFNDLGANVHLATVVTGRFGVGSAATDDVVGVGVIHTYRMGAGPGIRISEPVYRKLASGERSPWRKHQPPATYTLEA